MKWIEALKIFNKGKGEFCVPRKGSSEYEQVMKIMKDKPDDKKPAGAFLANTAKSRLQEEKYLKNVSQDLELSHIYQQNKKIWGSKKETDIALSDIKKEYETKLGREMDITDNTILKKQSRFLKKLDEKDIRKLYHTGVKNNEKKTGFMNVEKRKKLMEGAIKVNNKEKTVKLK